MHPALQLIFWSIFQVENEYGMYITCDHVYMTHLTGTFRKYLGNDVVLTTVDPPYDRYLECGTLPELLATLDFGPGTGNLFQVTVAVDYCKLEYS